MSGRALAGRGQSTETQEITRNTDHAASGGRHGSARRAISRGCEQHSVARRHRRICHEAPRRAIARPDRSERPASTGCQVRLSRSASKSSRCAASAGPCSPSALLRLRLVLRARRLSVALVWAFFARRSHAVLVSLVAVPRGTCCRAPSCRTRTTAAVWAEASIVGSATAPTSAMNALPRQACS